MFNHWLTHLVLSPLLLIQGVYVRVKTPRLPEAKGERQGFVSNDKPRLSFKVIGDSAAAGVGASHQQEALSGQILKFLNQRYSVNWQLEAWSGCTTSAMISHLDNLPSEKQNIVVTSLGVNDLITGVSIDTWLSQQSQLLQLIREKYSPEMIVLSALPEMSRFPALPQPLRKILGGRAELFNQRMRAFVTTQNDCFHLRLDIADTPSLMASDGFHPGPQAYELWGEAVVSAIEMNRAVVIEKNSNSKQLLVYSN
ncbi:SGNH/GDSL hydrolase family protein [Aliikangiella marina]|uniref:SGNH/GDSL hydrolase family protein n=1 Tax=Aliikangiella marina TaxID=1712262 RepID=UPI00163DCAFF|nr:SGNH/GDSL hydrolase family protein [Aliikangiella marina]